MSVFVFEWTRTVISQQYLDSMSLDSHADRNNVIKEMALTAKVKVEWNSNGQVFLEGTWQHIMKIHIMLAKYLKLPGEVNDEDESDEAASPPCGKSMSTSMPSSPVPKVDAKTVLRYIRQKYLNASRRKNEQFHQRNLPVQSKKVVPEVEQTDVAGNSDREVKQENEVYVNITMSGSLDNLPGLLLPVASSGHDLEQLPYEGSLPESDQLLNTGDLLVQHKGTLINKNILVDDIKSESHITVVDNSSGQTVCHYELPDNSIIETCQRSNAIDMGREFLEENVDGMKNLVAHTVHGSADVGRIVWHSDDIHSFQNQVANRNESTKSSDNVYPLSCEPADCTNGVKEEIDIQNVSRSCGKKKDYEKLAPFKFFCTLCSFKSKRESHYQRHLELHSKVSELFSCKKCDFTTIRLGHLRRHEMSHSDTKFACDMCHYHTDHHKFLLRHQRIKHANVQGHENIARKELLRCVECAYSTTRPFFYKRHLQAHTSADSSLLREEHRFQCQQVSVQAHSSAGIDLYKLYIYIPYIKIQHTFRKTQMYLKL
ncbi:hypothetical protein B7P43_G09537 [Cryptotermes secundus]|uniref:C2H2-type domain-containing protein n=1 Tax=Cryptotermes secundus TaxID=105785 RepID=A0A2J7QMR4_9NEOP|nr:hypothetical protein B7P43_G09537 [Cryptotermes secundus]